MGEWIRLVAFYTLEPDLLSVYVLCFWSRLFIEIEFSKGRLKLINVSKRIAVLKEGSGTSRYLVYRIFPHYLRNV